MARCGLWNWALAIRVRVDCVNTIGQSVFKEHLPGGVTSLPSSWIWPVTSQVTRLQVSKKRPRRLHPSNRHHRLGHAQPAHRGAQDRRHAGHPQLQYRLAGASTWQSASLTEFRDAWYFDAAPWAQATTNTRCSTPPRATPQQASKLGHAQPEHTHLGPSISAAPALTGGVLRWKHLLWALYRPSTIRGRRQHLGKA